MATLGPSGTSSERAAERLLELLGSPEGATLSLFDTYQEASRAVIDGRAAHLLVANAFHDVNLFYMDPQLCVGIVFHMFTPLYGLAARNLDTLRDGRSRQLSVVSHPAPVPLIAELLPPGLVLGPVSEASSTAAAATSVARREHDIALTTEPAARASGLTFVSGMRPIEMVWTAFVRSGEGLDGRGR
ncbi:hypothetical protein ACNHYB_06320 [Isoptericola jiangsuensis]|uniref:hypothetical protein n=1 Tax=Isoptericola jiangsuensis TaxID=548579 RepID=UPI003AAD56FF